MFGETVRTPKLVRKGTVQFVTTTVEQDLMFPANPLVELILRKCLAQALKLYGIVISHLLFETTHLHLLITIGNPEDLKDFMRHFKAESAHAINRLLGRRKRTVWCEGYDSPTILDLDKAIEMISYLYSNPAKDDLEDSIDKYPGFSTWRSFVKGEQTFKSVYLARDDFRKLSDNRVLTYREYSNEARILSRGRKRNSFRIFPDAWMQAFGVAAPEEIKKVNERIVRRVREREQEAREERIREGRSVIGARKLMNTQIGQAFLPRRSGIKTICLASSKKVRAAFIERAKRLFALGREIYEQWKKGEWHIPYPIGLYPPPYPRRAELLPAMN